MNGAVPLILSEEPVVTGLMARTKESRPNVAVVCADGEGRIDCFDGRPLKRSELAASHYRIQYEVDLSDHRRTARLDSSPLPAEGDTSSKPLAGTGPDRTGSGTAAWCRWGLSSCEEARGCGLR